MSLINIIGSGISGLSAACYSAKEGHKVRVFEKNATIGGRARIFSEQGFLFDMGPSWYWMPEVFERFFNDFGKTTSDYYQLNKLDPGFRIFFEGKEYVDISGNINEIHALFESIEPGSSLQLKKYLTDAKNKYTHGMLDIASKPSLSWLEFADLKLLRNAVGLNMFQSMRKHVASYFKDKRLQAIMEFPVLFLGAMPDNIPALYSLMNYAALEQGTWYPMGGMYKIIEAMHQLALSLGVEFYTGAAVEKIEVHNKIATGIKTKEGSYTQDALIATGDYHHIEQDLLEENHRNYNENYWAKKTLAPSCLIFYVGVNKKIPGLLHHNLFFDEDMNKHSEEIYQNPVWPTHPLFYVCCPSKTDIGVAPAGSENLFILMPVAVALEATQQLYTYYFDMMLKRIEGRCNINLQDAIVYKKTYSVNNFTEDYNAYKGNAYGLANTLNQTAILKPSIKNKKIKNMFYAGQLTVPGPGVPPCIISGQITANQVIKTLKTYKA